MFNDERTAKYRELKKWRSNAAPQTRKQHEPFTTTATQWSNVAAFDVGARLVSGVVTTAPRRCRLPLLTNMILEMYVPSCDLKYSRSASRL